MFFCLGNYCGFGDMNIPLDISVLGMLEGQLAGDEVQDEAKELEPVGITVQKPIQQA